jgi:phage terminase large subunit
MSKSKEITVCKQYYELEDSKARYVIFRGSTRSAKTISIIQNLLTKMMSNNNITIIIGVETLRQARASIIKDLEFWIDEMCLTPNMKMNKSEFTYQYEPTKSIIRILPCDKPSKWFGVKSDITWFNEATFIDKAIFEQAEMRLPDRKDFRCQIILDFNPTNPYSWVRELESNPQADVYVSTYKDNPFLGPKQIALIESWRETNHNKWMIFGQGEYGEVRGAIYTNWQLCDSFPKDIKYWYGLDFGFSQDVTALVKLGLQNGEIYVDELIYETGLTNPDICEILKELGITNRDEIIADSAEPKSIEEIRRLGFYIRGVKKGKDSITQGIDILQRYKINITKRSKHLQDEIINYTWKEDRKSGEFINQPVDDWNHLGDAMRYVALEKLGIKRTGGTIVIRT